MRNLITYQSHTCIRSVDLHVHGRISFKYYSIQKKRNDCCLFTYRIVKVLSFLIFLSFFKLNSNYLNKYCSHLTC